MLKLSLKRFATVLFFQMLFLVVDLGINSFSYLARGKHVAVIFLFIAQDVCLMLSFTAFVFSLYSTYVYQAGMANVLYEKFRTPLIISMTYFFLSIALHLWQVVGHAEAPYQFQWPKALTALFIIHRLFSPIYYYLYKKSALKMSDPRFYENLDWIASQLSIK
ncbi:transmembrane protein 138 [Anopheles ziemanni]|uniref:Transmembrane protein 138 n=1 Tax=Anopheles sinensis TaxID=74873 RepID=A0A084WD31_ANOSI|nr:transmembrane protein 138 [Anopheles coustani]XP_058166978.1 transmembrane protein 138 [Anopheles ziemanni]KFB48125.1 AGAP010215-PA-like protein [Anopheles sinensis]